jgi:hypothetical protein
MAIELRVCFKNQLKNTWLIVGTARVDHARRIARVWGERTENEPVIRTILKQRVPTPRGRPEIIDETKIWPPVF